MDDVLASGLKLEGEGGRRGARERAWHSQHEGRSEPDYTRQQSARNKERKERARLRRHQQRRAPGSFRLIPYLCDCDWGRNGAMPMTQSASATFRFRPRLKSYFPIEITRSNHVGKCACSLSGKYSLKMPVIFSLTILINHSFSGLFPGVLGSN